MANKPVQPQTAIQPDGMAITSLVMGILTILTSWIWLFAIIFGTLGLIFGSISYSKTKHKMALAGIICSATGLVLMVLVIILYIAFADDIGRQMYNSY